MIYGYKPKGDIDLPEWANQLTNFYWHIRVEGKNQAKRRRYYRLISKEKLRLAEENIDQQLINSVCRYLSNLSPKSEYRINALSKSKNYQLSFNFEFAIKGTNN